MTDRSGIIDGGVRAFINVGFWDGGVEVGNLLVHEPKWIDEKSLRKREGRN